MKRIVVSACLLGVPCRYDGKSIPSEKIISLAEKYELIPVCAELFGGLPTPRIPCEIVGEKVIRRDGADVTENYEKGAAEVLRLCKLFGADTAILKEKSPSCGKGLIYDGTFSGKLIEGDGVTVSLLEKNGIRVIGETLAGEIL